MGRFWVAAAALWVMCLPLRAGLLTGSLRDAAGAPVAGATVWLMARDSGEAVVTRRTVTAADGRFDYALSSEARRSALLLARVPGRGCLACSFRLPSGPRDLALEPGFELAGEAVDADGRPLAGISAQLTALCPGWPEWPIPSELLSVWSTVTDARGVWRLSGVPRPDRQVTLRGARTTVVQAEIGPAYQWLPASISTLRPAGEVRGRLLRADGRPAVGELLQADEQQARCDAQGRFYVGNLPVGTEVVIKPASSCGCGGSGGVVLGKARVGGPESTFRLPRRGRVRGVVQLASGRPAAGVKVDAYGDGNNVQGITDAAGRYELEVWPGDVEIHASGGTSRVAAHAHVGAGAVVTAKALTPPPAFRRLRVVDSAGQPLANAPVWVSSGADVAQTTDADGRLALPNTWWSSQDDFSVLTLDPLALADGELPAAEGEVTFKLAALPPADTATCGQVVDDAGQPVAGARVTLGLMRHGRRYMDVREALSLTTDADGRWKAGALPRWWVVVGRVTAAGHRGAKLQMTTGDEERTTLERRNARVSGTVVDSGGQPVAGALVYGEGCLGEDPAVSDAEGRFTCGDLPHRRMMVVAQRGRNELSRAACDAPSSGLRLTLAPTPAPIWRPEPTRAEEQRAMALIDSGLAEGDGSGSSMWLTLLASGDPADALDRLLRLDAKRMGQALPDLLGATPAGVYYDERLMRAVRALPAGEWRTGVAASASDHLPPARRDLHAELLAMAREGFAKARANYYTFSADPEAEAEVLAKLTLRAGLPAKEELAELVKAYRRSLKDRDLGVISGSNLPATLVDVLTPACPDARQLFQWRCEALCDLFAVSPDTAWATARRWWPGRDGQPDWPWRSASSSSAMDRLAAVVARQAVARDGAAGLLRMPSVTSEQALTCALSAGDAATGRRLAAIAEARCPRERQSASARLALAVGLDAALAERSRRRTLSEWTFDPYTHEGYADAAEAMSDGSLSVAYGLALIEPNRARWYAEAVYSGGAARSGELTPAVMAMAAADLDRAERMVREQGIHRNEARQLARWLLSDGGERARFYLGSRSGSIVNFGRVGDEG